MVLSLIVMQKLEGTATFMGGCEVKFSSCYVLGIYKTYAQTDCRNKRTDKTWLRTEAEFVDFGDVHKPMLTEYTEGIKPRKENTRESKTSI